MGLKSSKERLNKIWHGVRFCSLTCCVTKLINKTDHNIEFDLLVPTGKIEVSGNFSIDKLVAKADSRVFHIHMAEFLRSAPGFQILAIIHVDGNIFTLHLQPKLLLYYDLVHFSYSNADGFSASFSSKLMEINPVEVVDKVLLDINPVEVVDEVLLEINPVEVVDKVLLEINPVEVVDEVLLKINPVEVVDEVLLEINPGEVVDKVLLVANGHTIDIN